MIEKIKKIAKKLWNFLKEIEERKTTLGFIACALVLSFGIVIPNNTSVSEEKDRQGNNQNTKSLERTEGMFVEKCDFNDLNNWLGIENFEIEKDDIFKPKLSENFPNSREMFCDEKIGMNFSLPICRQSRYTCSVPVRFISLSIARATISRGARSLRAS